MDGWTATRHLKSDARTRAIPVVALTGHALAGSSDGARQAGCDAFVTQALSARRARDRAPPHTQSRSITTRRCRSSSSDSNSSSSALESEAEPKRKRKRHAFPVNLHSSVRVRLLGPDTSRTSTSCARPRLACAHGWALRTADRGRPRRPYTQCCAPGSEYPARAQASIRDDAAASARAHVHRHETTGHVSDLSELLIIERRDGRKRIDARHEARLRLVDVTDACRPHADRAALHREARRYVP